MIVNALFSLLVGEVVKGFYTQKASNAVLRTWTSYTQGNHDLQNALKSAFVKTPAMLALVLVQEPWLIRQLKFTSPKLSREFAETIDATYVKPFCGNNQEAEQKLRSIAKNQCKALGKFFAEYPFNNVSAEEIANLLYNVRFVTETGILRKQAQLTKRALKTALSQMEFDRDFVELLFFPDTGSGVLYDGVVYHFEEEIKSNERVSKILAYFDRQQIVANLERVKQQNEKLNTQIAGLEAQSAECMQARKFSELSAIAGELGTLDMKHREIANILAISEKNVKVWQQVETELSGIRGRFKDISRELAGHFEELQTWLDSEFEDEMVRLVRSELQHFFNGQSEIEVEELDFLAKPYTLADRYEKLERLGSGGLAEVYKMKRKYLNSIVALKILLEKHRRNPETVARFWAEGKIMGSLSSVRGRHFAKVREMGRSADGDYFIEMDFVAGSTLHTLLKEQGPLPQPFALRLLRQLAVALNHAHTHRIIHRDIKPQNIIAAEDGHLTLIDFGIAKRLDTDSLVTPGGMFYGTFQYAAPEQFDDAFGKISARTDIYSLGILGYQLLSNNKSPFEGKTLAKISYAHCHKPLPEFPMYLNIHADVAALIVKCAQKRQEDRFQNMQEVAAAIDEILQQEAIEEYQEYFTSLLPGIDQRKRRVLEKYRQRLGLSREVSNRIERELSEESVSEDVEEFEEILDLTIVEDEQEPPSEQTPKTPVIHLRSKPLAVSEDDARKVFGLDENSRPLKYIENDFEVRGEVVIDSATGLMWQKSGSDESMSYQAAQAYIDKLNRERFAGYDDWRLPTSEELMSLLEPEKQSNDLYIKPIFDNRQGYWWGNAWSADKGSSGSAESAWGVLFYTGRVDWSYLNFIVNVRAVRS